MKRCQACGEKTEKQKPTRPYHYTESGLKNVYIDGIMMFRCPACDAEFPEIPNVEGLHASIADALMRKPYTLTGREFRFLRKEMRMRAKDLATVLGVTPTTVSRWETGVERVGIANDRLIRSLYILWLLKNRKIVDPSTILERVSAHFRTISPKPKSVQIRLPANPAEPVLVA